MTLRTALSALALALALPALPAGAQGAGGDPLRVGATYLTSGLDPSQGSNGWALVSHGIGETLFTVDAAGARVGGLATGAERLSDLLWRIDLAPGRFFSDGTPVTAAALAEGFAQTLAANPVAAATGGTLAFAAEGELGLLVTTERPVPVIDALLAEWPMIAYKPTPEGAVLTGPYMVEDFQADASLDLVPNPHVAGAEGRGPIAYRRFGDAQAMALAFEAGELDIAFGLPPESLARLRASPEGQVLSFPVGYQYFAFLNTREGPLADAALRNAVDLAIDRDELVLAINGGGPATGAFAPYFDFAPAAPRPTDAAAAAAILDAAGWVPGADGVRERDGERLALDVLAYPQRPDLVAMLPVINAQLEALGIEVATEVVDNISDRLAAGEFDLALWAQHTAPTADPAFFLNAMVASGGAQNYAGYANPAFDAIVAELNAAEGAEARRDLALAAQAQIFEDDPLVFLVAPEWHVGVSEAARGYEPWGSDYHVIRADMGAAADGGE